MGKEFFLGIMVILMMVSGKTIKKMVKEPIPNLIIVNI